MDIEKDSILGVYHEKLFFDYTGKENLNMYVI